MYFNVIKKNNWPQLIHALFWFVSMINIWLLAILQNIETPFYKALNQSKRTIPLLLYLICFTAIIYSLEKPANKFSLFFMLVVLLFFLTHSIICNQMINQDNTILSFSVRIIFIFAQYLICLYFTFSFRPKNVT